MDAFAFEDLASFDLIKAIYKYGFEIPSPVQQYSIPKLIRGQSISVNAQTGSGKTAAFGISLLSLVNPQKSICQAVIVSPTKELSNQTLEVIDTLGTRSGIKGVCLTSGVMAKEQFEKITKGSAHFVCVTPKRLSGLCAAIQLSKLQLVILDECDKLLEEQSYHGVASFLRELAPETIIGCFSATATDMYRQTIKELCPVINHISIIPQHSSVTAIRHVCIRIFNYTNTDVERATSHKQRQSQPKAEDSDDWLEPRIKRRSRRKSYKGLQALDEDKNDAGSSKEEICAEKVRVLSSLLESVPIVQGIIFCNSKHTVDWLYNALRKQKHPCERIHADVPAFDRETTVANFRAGKTRLLVSTDLLARGFDVQQVTFVCNYDFPRDPHSYMHRAGRCGRFGRKGLSVSLLTAENQKCMDDVVQRYKIELETI
ncbi:Eukaryotic initiation factor 4A [Giardia lamblia P15]|uniref:Eukaryotic initiation factor 4A n=1 Tax=Giardia intestinalis (strain P15) TaxID=658858 RepID=E1F9K6_GIAIA|nr:Eukaryotic initiation factor 4A [Giardia lamblia P15]